MPCNAKAYTVPMSRIGLVLVVVFVLIGPTPLVIGAVATWRALAAHREQVSAQAGWTETVAEVTACSAYNPSKSPGQWPYTFESEWKDTKGHVHPGAGSGNTCKTGERYAIQYNPENLKQFSTPVGPFVPIPLILCLIGAAFIGIAIKGWRKAKAK